MESSVVTTSSGSTGPLGHPRGIGFGILIYIITIGFYGWYWIYKTMEEIGGHVGEGLGGVLSLVIWILLAPVMAFVTPAEVGRMYAKDGQEPPVSGWTGLWLFPFGVPDRSGDRLVREDPGRAEPLLGREGRDRGLEGSTNTAGAPGRLDRPADEARAGDRVAPRTARSRAICPRAGPARSRPSAPRPGSRTADGRAVGRRRPR